MTEKWTRQMMDALPQTKRESDFQLQRDRLAEALRKVLKVVADHSSIAGRPFGVSAAEAEARQVLVEIFGR